MKTVFQRTLSVIMCVVLVVCTMSAMAYAATDFTYDKYMDRTSKSVDMNTIQVFDEVDDMLPDDLIIDLEKFTGIALGVVNLTSVDNALATIDDFRGKIKLATTAFADLNTLTFDAFEEGLTRKDDGDVKIVTELLELAGSNGDIISDFLSGTFSLGAVDAVLEGEGFYFSEVPNMIKGALVDIFYDSNDAEYDMAYDRATSNFDAFMCQDIIPAVIGFLADAIGLDPANSNLELDTTSTVNTVIAEVFDIAIVNLKTVIGKLNIKLEGTSLDSLKDELILKGTEYDLNAITGFDGSKPVLDQINTVVGSIIAQLVPNYTGWQAGDYTKLEANVRNIFLYLADKAGFATTGKSDVEIMVDVIRTIFAEVNVPGDYSSCTTIEAMAKELIKALAIKEGTLPADITYTSAQTYEHVLGDIIISIFSDDVLIATPDGKVCEIGDGYDVWTVWNYILNFFFVDKNLDLLLGKDGMTKESSLFDKFDAICDMFADDGTSSFETETYIKSLINSLFTLDLGGFVELTAVKALNFAKEGNVPGGVSVSKFVYKTLYAFLYNWAGKKAVIPAYTAVSASKPFNDALSGTNLGNLVETVIIALSGCTYKIKTVLGVETSSKEIVSVGTSRAPAICSLLGLLVNGSDTVSVDVSSVADAVYTGKALDPAAVVYATYRGKTVRLEQNVDYKVTVDKNAIGSTTATIEGIGAYKGAVSGKSVNIKFGTLSGLTAKPASTSSVTLSWNKLAGANSYNVYNGSTLVKNVTTNSYTVTGLKAGTKYTFKVEAVNGSNKSAQASVSTVTLPAQVTGLKATTPSNTKVKLTWSAVTGAAGYYVQQYTSGAWKTVKTVTTNSVTLSASANTAYSFRVIAYSANSAGTKYSGAASASVSARTAPNKPSSLAKKTVTSSTVTLSWKAVSGATGYEIYDSKGNKVGSTKSTSYTVKKLSANTKYTYKVRAYVTVSKKTYYSDFTSTVSATTLLAAPKSFKVKSATATSLTVSWKKVSGAKKYQVYYSTDGKKWKKATTSKTSYTISDLKANTSFEIKVRAYNSSSVYGDYTSVLSASTAPSKVSISKLSAGKNKFTVTWKKVSGAEGYEIQYSTSSNFKSSKTVTVKKGKTVKSEIKKLKKGTKYYVRVRAYKTVNGEKLYGKYSEYETVKVK